MIESLLGSKNAERVLIYIFARNEGYARKIAGFYETDLKSIQMQLEKFERSGMLVSREVEGRYFINPETQCFVEFPEGPLSAGEQPVKEISEFELATGLYG